MNFAYYNENDPFNAAWLKTLIGEGHIMQGVVDDRDIRDVCPSDLRGFVRHHFFAGIGVWDYALRLAEWPEDLSICTGSCPCQPFSTAGKGKGTADERHLWPAWFHLIENFEFERIVGEQVASKTGLAWLDLVQADLEGQNYSFGAVDLCAAGVGAPHIRQRSWFLADSTGERHEKYARIRKKEPRWYSSKYLKAAGCGEVGVMGNANFSGLERRGLYQGERPDFGSARASDSHAGFWSDADWIACRDGKKRPVEPGTFPLAHGTPDRVGRVRGYGNAINAETAAIFLRTVQDVLFG